MLNDGLPCATATTPPQTSSLRYLVFDIEIAKTIDQTPGGWEGARTGLAGFACAAAYDSESERTILFGPQDVDALASMLEEPVVVVSFNGAGFDVPAIEGILKRQLKIRTHLDLLDLFVSANGTRKGLKLDEICHRTLGTGKSGSGAMAPLMYQEGLKGGEDGVQKIAHLLNYCALDVTLTRDLLRFVQKHGYVIGPSGPLHLTLPPYFSRLPR